MALSRRIPIHYENEWWPRHYDNFYAPFPAWTSYSGDHFPLRTQREFEYEDIRRDPVNQMQRDMKRMTDEMNRMMSNVPTRSNTASSVTVPALPGVDDWRLTENFRMDNPIKQEYDGSRKFCLQFDLRQFKPEEIHVKTSGNQLTVQARHDEKNSERSSFREYCRQYVLPKEVRPDLLVSKLRHDGVLNIEAPLPALSGPQEKLIAIEHSK